MSRLYPGWGSGAIKNRLFLRMRTVCDIKRKDNFNEGDKVILPQSALKEFMRLKLDFPLLLQVHRIKALKAIQPSKPLSKTIICGVLEFSRSDNKALIPLTVLGRLTNIEKNRDRSILISIQSLTQHEREAIPKAISCKFQPFKEAFLVELLNDGVNIVEFMEKALKSYTTLSLGQCILVLYASNRYKIKVTELYPDKLVSLLGNVDVLIDFATPIDGNEVGRIRPRKDSDNQPDSPPSNYRCFSHPREVKLHRKFEGKGMQLSKPAVGCVESHSNDTENGKENSKANSGNTTLSVEDIRQKRLAFLDRQLPQVI